jgi:hypothetical protein
MASSSSSAVEAEHTNGLRCFGCWKVLARLVSETTSTSPNRRRCIANPTSSVQGSSEENRPACLSWICRYPQRGLEPEDKGPSCSEAAEAIDTPRTGSPVWTRFEPSLRQTSSDRTSSIPFRPMEYAQDVHAHPGWVPILDTSRTRHGAR